MEEGALVLNLVLLNLASFNKLMSQTDYTSIHITIDCTQLDYCTRFWCACKIS